jgi:ABC-2 type transport system ATP-binding protein
MIQTDTSPQAAAGVLAPPAIRLASITKRFGAVEAVKDLTLEVHQGEVVAFLGPNGAGKTTTIDMILGLSAPDAGHVEVLGMPPRDAIARGLVAAVMQTGGLLKDLTVRETVRYTASLFASATSVDEVLETAGITEIANRTVAKCSGGEQQRLRFAMALLPDPALLLLDEPTTGMDVEGRRTFWSSIRRDADRGRTILFATHYLEEADQYADRVVMLSHGQVVADGTGSQIKAHASGRLVRATLEDADDALRTLRATTSIDEIEVRGDQVYIHATDSDAVARFLLTRTDARDLEITARGLEDAFVTLTSEGSR